MKRNELRFLISQRVPSACAGTAHGHVRVAAEGAFLHVAVADADPAHEGMQRLRVGDGLGGGAHVGLGDDLEQRRPGAVQVDARHAVEILVQRLACVLLEVRPREPHALLLGGEHEGDGAAAHHRQLVLADLVALREVGIEIILAREDAPRREGAAHGEAEADRALHRAAVEHRQRAGKREVHRRGLGVGRGAERGRGAGEDLRRGGELRVGLQPDHDFPLTHRRPRSPSGERACQSVACWNAWAAASMRASSQ